jgi:hypothetical protein
VAKKNQSEELVRQEPAYIANIEDMQMVMEALRENIGGEQLSRFDFPRITIPQGNARHMTVITEEDPEGEAMTEFSGIIVANHMARSYWRDTGGQEVGNTPPDCSSPDAIIGFGSPGGDCESCPFAQFGSDRGGEGRGQACKQMRTLYILRPGMMLPVVVNVPPTSLKSVREYLFRLAQTGRPQYVVETEIGLLPKTNPNNQPYNQFTFKRARPLEGEELATAVAYARMFKQLLQGGNKYPPVPEAAIDQ